jgi:tetratricopeptide (TPR) repeat protein
MSTTLALILSLSLDTVTLSDGRSHLEAGNRFFQSGLHREAQAEFLLASRHLDPGGSAPELAQALNNLAASLAAQHEFHRALPVFRRAMNLAASHLGPLDRAVIAANTAQTLARIGDLAEAGNLIDRAIPVCELARCTEWSSMKLIRAGIHILRMEWRSAHADLDHVLLSSTASAASFPIAHYLRGLLCQRQGNHRLAAVEFALSVDLAAGGGAWKHTLEYDEMLVAYALSLKKIGHSKLARRICNESKKRKLGRQP